MNVYKISPIKELIGGNPYVGRGIIIGKTPDGDKAAVSYFIMGRSANSRNRIFNQIGNELYTEPFDVSKVGDPSLIIYAAIREYENNLVVTNGNQTDTVIEGLAQGLSFEESLETREFEPDGPNYTPRISGILKFNDDDFSYRMSILKSMDPNGSACARYSYSYQALKGLGHFIHTYITDGNPIPTFMGEPERVEIPADIDQFTDEIWNNLDAENRISLYVRYIDLHDLSYEDRMINKNA